MSTGADNKSMPGTAGFRDGYDRTFGDRKAQRGIWVQDPVTGKLIRADEYQPPSRALDAPVMVDRFMEGAVSMDGADIGSRAKRKEYMRRNGVVDASDVSRNWLDGRRADKDQRASEATKRTVVELSKVDTRNLRNAVDQLKGKR